jgi:RNA polymerase sigma-70 factor (ECF subfamily)
VDDSELADLLSKARQGKEGALERLLERLRPWLRQRAEKRLGQGLGARLDGSDVVQEVHLRLWDHFDQFRGDTVGQLLAWVDGIVDNCITDCRRRQGAAKRNVGVEVAGGDRFPGLAADATTPSQGAMRNEDAARLAEALQHLSETQRLVFRLRFFEGLPFEEVAHRAGVTAANARVLMLRATERLRNELGEKRD